MLQYIRDNYDALYLTDANGVATSADLLDANGVSLLTGTTPVFQVPNTFASNQWSVATGSNPSEIVINISVLPAANGSPITAIQYRVGTGAWVTLPDAVTGAYPVAMAATSTAYSISLRAINIVGPSAQSVAKTATSGAPAATAPAAFGPAQWSLSTGTEPASLALNIISLPANGGSAITAIEYRVGSGEWVALADAETGPRSITMPAASTAYSITLRAVNAVNPGNPSAAKTATSSGAALSAPSRVPDSPLPSISGNTPVGSTLTRATTGEFTGNPTPQKQALWGEKKVGATEITIISGQNGETFTPSASNYAAADEIFTGTRAYNSQGEIIVWSEPWTLTVQPAITAPPITLTAGQQATIQFNTTPDTVTVAQGDTTLTATRVGTTNDWTVIPLTAEPVIIGATKAGWKDYSATITPAPAVADIESSPSDWTAIIRNLTPASPADALIIAAPSRYAGTHPFNPAALTNGPLILIEPSLMIAEQKVDLDLGIQIGAAYWDGAPFVDGIERISNNESTYVWQAGDAGKTLDWRGVFFDGSGGEVPFQTDPFVIPSLAATDTFSSADNTPLVPGPHESGKTWNKFGSTASPAVILGGYLIAGANYRFIMRSDDVSGGNYTATFEMRSTNNLGQSGYGDRGAHPAIGISGLDTGYYFQNLPANNAVRIYERTPGVSTILKSKSGHVGNNVDYTLAFVVTDHVNVAVQINGVDIPELAFTDTGLQGGGVGIWNAAVSGNFDTYNKINSLSVEIN